MSATGEPSRSSSPWHPNPPNAQKVNPNQSPLHSSNHRWRFWISILLFTVANLFHWNSSPVSQDLTSYIFVNRPIFGSITAYLPRHHRPNFNQIAMKRADPSSPARGVVDEEQKIKSPPKNKQFTGGRAMDEEQTAWPTPEEQKRAEEQLKEEKKKVDDAARAKRREERAARIAEQKRTGIKVRKPKDGEWNKAKKNNQDKSKTQENQNAAKASGQKKPGRARGRSVDSISRNKSGVSASKTTSGKTDGKRTKKSRGESVDSGLSKISKDSSAASEATSPKRKKSAAFAEGIPNNEGKTASTRKQQKAKDKESYARKAAKEKKTGWAYTTIIKWTMRLGQCRSTCAEVYSRHKKAFTIMQTYDATCSIADHMNPKSSPLRSPGDFPSENEHGRYQRFFTLDNEQDWSWDNNITNSNPRNFAGSFILLSDKEPVELFRFIRVDLRNQVQGVYEIKAIQELYTVLSQVSLGVHANCDPELVANELRLKLIKVEADILDRKKNWLTTSLGFYEPIFDEVKDDWAKTDACKKIEGEVGRINIL